MAEYGFAIIHHPSNKLAENLDMCETCVNTHTHTHTFSPDVSRARQYTLLLYICKGGNSLFGSFPPFSVVSRCTWAGKMKNRKMKNEERRIY